MIPDTSIMDWFVDPDQNMPTDGTFVGTDMPRQLRNIKSITREQYGDRWEAFPLVPTKKDADTVEFPNDGTVVGFPLPAFGGWAIRFWSPTGVLSYGYAKAVTIGTPTTVDVVMTSGILPDLVQRMDIGMIPEARAYHELGRRGTFVLGSADTSVTITFASLALPPMPRALYDVMFMSAGAIGGGALPTAFPDSFIPQSLTTSTTGFTVTFIAPGGTRTITWQWAILFPFQSVNY